MIFLQEYATQGAIVFTMVKRSAVDLAASADWTPATGDTKISQDGGNVANTTNNPAAVGGTGSVLWSLTLTASELTCAVATIQIVDSATKAVEDQALKVYTVGHPSAKYIINPLKPRALVSGVCTTGGSTTSVVASTTVPASGVDNQWLNRLLIFNDNTTTANLRGQFCKITAYSHSTKTFTVTTLTTAPASGDVFFIY